MPILYFFLLFFSSTVFADEVLPGVSAAESHPYWKEFVNMLVTLVFILALILFSVWFLKRVLNSRLRHHNKSTGIKILERRPLTSKSSLYLISVLGKGVVIAESGAGIQLVTELSDEKDIELLLSEKLEEKQSPTFSFASVFQKKMKEMIKRDGVS